MKHKVYKVINTLDKKFYIGVTKGTLNKRLMGHARANSHIGSAIRKYGLENFTIELQHSFDSKEESYLKESEIVDDLFILREDTYNKKLGGEGGFDYINDNGLAYVFTKEDNEKASQTNRGKVNVKDEEGNNFKVSLTDERYLSGELIHNTVGMTVVIENGVTKQVTLEDFNKLNLKGVASGTVSVKILSSGKQTRIPIEEYKNNRHLYKSLGSLPGNKNGKALKIKVFNSNDEFIFESHGDFEIKCKEYGLDSYLIKKSYQKGTKIESKKARKSENRKLDGWYAVKQ